MFGAMRVFSEPLDDVDGLAHILGAIVEFDDVDSAPIIGGEDGADGRFESSSTRLKWRGEVMRTT